MSLRTVKLGSIAKITSGGTPDRQNPNYWGGTVPWVKTTLVQNREITLSEIDERITEIGLKRSSAKLIPAGSILMAMVGQGKTRGQVAILATDAAINQNCAAIMLSDQANCRYVYQQLLFRYEEIRKASNSSGQQNLNAALIRELRMLLPTLAEQEIISDVLFAWDTAIQKTEKLIAAKERHYSHELSGLISRDQHKTAHVGTFANEVSTRNRGNEARVLSVTNSRGFVLPEDQFERRVASADLSNYKVVRRGQYAYNPSRINVGSIARLDGWDRGVLSPMYVVFQLDEDKIDSDYFLHWLNSYEARQRIKNSAQGSVRETVSFAELAAITIPLPTRTKQTSIARYLNALRTEIDLLGQSVAALRAQKRGLMQKLLTGEWRLQIAGTEEVRTDA
jgi:type I restriction enzyme S subunit